MFTIYFLKTFYLTEERSKEIKGEKKEKKRESVLLSSSLLTKCPGQDASKSLDSHLGTPNEWKQSYLLAPGCISRKLRRKQMSGS